MKILVMTLLALLISTSGAFAEYVDIDSARSGNLINVDGAIVLAQAAEEPKQASADAQSSAVSAPSTPANAEAAAPEAGAPAAGAAGAGSASLWQKIKNMFSSGNDTKTVAETSQEQSVVQEQKATESAAKDAPVNNSPKAPEEAVQATPASPEQKAPQAGDAGAAASTDAKGPDASAPAAAAGAGSVSLWQKIKNAFSLPKDGPVPAENAPGTAAGQELKAVEPSAMVSTETNTAEKEVLVTSATGTSAETKSLWQRFTALWSSPLLDLRVKRGGAAELDKLTLYGTTYSGSGASSDNLQVEANFGLFGQSNIGFIASAGVFKRQHSGSAVVSSKPTSVDYDAAGITLGAGAGWKVNKKLHVEGKFELGMGTGQPTFSSPGTVWNQSKADGYGSYALILGAYYTFRDPGFQLGLELGTQTFSGNYSIMNNASQWIDAKVEGNSKTVNLVAGYRF